MNDIYHLDFETYSEADLKKYGAFRYASDSSTEILMFAICKNDGFVHLWDTQNKGDLAMNLLNEAVESESLIYAHNAQFESAICAYVMETQLGISNPKLRQWRCTAAMARRAAIPSSLEKAAEFLGLTAQKDNRGKALIRKFSIPDKKKGRTFPQEDPGAFVEFGEYCIQDVETERELHKKLKSFELTGDTLDQFQFDARMNLRGIPVNISALNKTNELVNDYQEEQRKVFKTTTGLNPTQGVAFLKWIKDRGYPGKNLTVGTVSKVLSIPPEAQGMTQEAYDALQLKSVLSFAAVKKIPTMLGAVCPDGTVKGSFMWSGAERTHRWSGRIVQPQNFRKPSIKDTGLAYKILCRGTDTQTLELLFGSTLETVSSCIRNFIQPKEGLFLDADYSAIEARVAPWLCGDEDKLGAFREGKPIYEIMASRIFRLPLSDINSFERSVGKFAELGCGYQMGGDKFKSTCDNFGVPVTQELSDKAVQTWRANNVKIVNAWKSIFDAAKASILAPGKTFNGTDKIKFTTNNKAGFPALIMSLPSGHKLIYPHPKVELVEKEYKGSHYTTAEITYYGKLPGSALWGRLSTYGGKLLENATQAVAGDILANGVIVAEANGFEIFMVVHDQALAPLDPKSDPDEALKRYLDCLCTLPDWANGLPIDAEGKIVKYYKK